MVTRRTRNYKEKKPMTTFGQLILPLTVIMAVALLFFSVKLFFFNSNEPDNIVLNKQETAGQKTVSPVPEEKLPAQKLPDQPVQKKVEIKHAQPVDIKKENQQKEESMETAAVKAPAKSSGAVKETAEQKKNKQAAVKESRWDVQIGAFSSKENSLQLIEKVKAQGYTAYLTEDKKDGTIFYKVRVKNPNTGRDEAEAFAKKLEKDGYPFFLVEIK
ncbi:MAG: SPOR domain-containing protein [Synergistaceae bacterium]|nr:SPOR domain-containing protein [Synergistaceae bacterium]